MKEDKNNYSSTFNVPTIKSMKLYIKFSHTGSGHYLSLLNTNSRPNMAASVTTPFIKTNGMCLQLFYVFLGSGEAVLSINLIREDLSQLQLYKVSVTITDAAVVAQARACYKGRVAYGW